MDGMSRHGRKPPLGSRVRRSAAKARVGPPIDSVTPRVKAAREALRLGRHRQALALFSEAVRREPQNVRAFYEAARAHADCGDFLGFNALARRLGEIAPRHPGVHHLAGELYEWLSLPRQAAACFEKACRLPGAQGESMVALAAQWERVHLLDAASELIDRALASDPDLP